MRKRVEKQVKKSEKSVIIIKGGRLKVS